MEKIIDKVVKSVVFGYYEIENYHTPENIKSRRRELVLARQLVIYFNKMFNKSRSLTLERLARMVGKTNHATAVHALKTIKNLTETNRDFRQEVEMLRREVRKNLGLEKAFLEEKFGEADKKSLHIFDNGFMIRLFNKRIECAQKSGNYYFKIFKIRSRDNDMKIKQEIIKQNLEKTEIRINEETLNTILCGLIELKINTKSK